MDIKDKTDEEISAPVAELEVARKTAIDNPAAKLPIQLDLFDENSREES